jgi:predicted nucleic acid-binding protein
MDKSAVYLETSVISYLTNRPSRDVIVAGHQATTREWWESKRAHYELYISELVIVEAGRGHAEAAAKRMALLEGISLLRMSDAVMMLSQRLIDRRAIPEVASADAIHVATAAVNGVHYLLTWNCKHIANAERFDAICTVCLNAGYRPPIICTPDELSGDA